MPGAIMKSLVRLSAAVGLVSSTVLGVLVAGGLQVLALTPEQIIQKLRPIPVFTIANAQGAPLVASPPNGEKGGPVAGVFISQKDAVAFLENLKSKNPNLAKEVKVVPVSLAEVYQLNKANQGKPNELDFAYVPTKQQVDSAVAVLKQNGQDVKQYNGTPLFVARAGKDKGFLTIQQGNQAVIPMFFNKEELQGLLDRFKQQQPDLAGSVDIQVFPLEGVMEAMQKQNDPQLDKIVLIPARESIEFVRSLQSGGGAPAAQPKPQTPAAPAKKK
jgi:Tic22-like family